MYPQQKVGKSIPDDEILEENEKNNYLPSSRSAFGSRDKHLGTVQLIWSSPA